MLKPDFRYTSDTVFEKSSLRLDHLIGTTALTPAPPRRGETGAPTLAII
jgi:hypothetical protein